MYRTPVCVTEKPKASFLLKFVWMMARASVDCFCFCFFFRVRDGRRLVGLRAKHVRLAR